MNPTDTTNDPRENLSSFMDGEVDKSAGSFLVRRLANDADLRATWNRYHMIRDCLHQQDADLVQKGFCARVSQAIEQEDNQQISGKTTMGWLKPMAGAAIAASVAMLAILSVGNGQQTGPGSVSQAAPLAVQAKPFVSPNMGNPIPDSQPVNLAGQRASEQEKAKAYLLRHYQLTGDGAGQGFVALVPIVVSSGGTLQAENPEVVATIQEAESAQ